MTPLDPQNVALARDPFTRQEVQIEPATGNLYGMVNGYVMFWHCGGGLRCGYISPDRDDILVPLQTRPKALRFSVQVRPDGMVSGGMIFPHQTHAPLAGCTMREMIERAPAEALAKAVGQWLRSSQPVPVSFLEKALAAYRAAYPEETK